MPQFKTASREEVREASEELRNVVDVARCGEGLALTYRRDDKRNEVHSYTSLVERYGWYVAQYEPRTDGDIVILMPVTSNAGGEE